MYKKYLSPVFFVLILIMPESYAQKREINHINPGIEAVINYAVNDSSPQFISFSDLSPSRSYILSCFPYTNLNSPEDIAIVVWTDKGTFSGTFGGVNTKPISFSDLIPYQQDPKSYAIEYQLTTQSPTLQKGTCVFK